MKKVYVFVGGKEVMVRIAGFTPENWELFQDLMCKEEVRDILDWNFMDEDNIPEGFNFMGGDYEFTGPVYDSITVVDEDENTLFEGEPKLIWEGEYFNPSEWEEDEHYIFAEETDTVNSQVKEYIDKYGKAFTAEEWNSPAPPFVLELPDDEEFDPSKLKLNLVCLSSEDYFAVKKAFYDGKELEQEYDWCTHGNFEEYYMLDEDGVHYYDDGEFC